MNHFPTFLDSLKRDDNKPIIEGTLKAFSIIFEAETALQERPTVRTLVTWEALEGILKSGFVYSRPELAKISEKVDEKIVIEKGLEDDDEEWWKEREKSDKKRFGTENLVFCTPDWLDDEGHETGHGPVMLYFKPSIYDDFKLTMTEIDSLDDKKSKVLGENDILETGKQIKSGKPTGIAKKIRKNMEHKNDDGFFDKYAEIQVHTKKIPVKYIEKAVFTDNYPTGRGDKASKERAMKLLRKKKSISLTK